MQRAVLAALDEHALRAEREDLPRGLDEVALAGEQARLPVVDGQHVDRAEQLDSSSRLPSIQKFIVSSATSFGAVHLSSTLELQLGLMLARKRRLRVAVGGGQLRAGSRRRR